EHQTPNTKRQSIPARVEGKAAEDFRKKRASAAAGSHYRWSSPRTAQPEAAVTTPSLDRLVKRLHPAFDAGRTAAGEDAERLRRFCGAGDRAAFEARVRRHGGLVLAACRAVLADEADVEDAFQATFLVLLRNARSIRRRQSVGSFLYGVARRVALRA